MKKILIYCLMLLPLTLMAACGDSDDPEDSGSSTRAWLCSTSEDGTDVDIVITFNDSYSGIYRYVVNNRMSRSTIYYEREGNTYECRVGSSSSTDFIFTIDGSSATGYDGFYYYKFRAIDLENYYQDWYDNLARNVKMNLETYQEGGNLAWLFLDTAKEQQKSMANVRSYAQMDGIYIEQSEWETKSSEGYNDNLTNEWITKYNAQVEKVKELYYEYRQCTDRFSKSAVKSSYESAQYTLIRIRAQAKDNGVTITPSEWETKDIDS